jgi:ABC-2 type transport system permease protein
MKILILIKKELLEQVRSKKLFVISILFLFIAVSSPILAKLIPELFTTIPGTEITLKIPDATWIDGLSQYVKNVSQIAVIAIIFLFAGSISEEKNKKTLELLLSKPISRIEYILGKFVSGFLVITIINLLAGLIFYIYSNTLFNAGNFMNFLVINLILTLILLLIQSITIFFSSMNQNQINAAGLSFLSYVIISTILPLFEKLKVFLPTYILSMYSQSYIDGDFTVYTKSIITCLMLIFILIGVSILLFNKQEIER